MGTITSQVDELMAEMTPAEKAAQLTQYFYFRLPAGAEVEPALGVDRDAQPAMVESALQEAASGRCCS
jgi:beta-glucosidase